MYSDRGLSYEDIPAAPTTSAGKRKRSPSNASADGDGNAKIVTEWLKELSRDKGDLLAKVRALVSPEKGSGAEVSACWVFGVADYSTERGNSRPRWRRTWRLAGAKSRG